MEHMNMDNIQKFKNSLENNQKYLGVMPKYFLVKDVFLRQLLTKNILNITIKIGETYEETKGYNQSKNNSYCYINSNYNSSNLHCICNFS